MRFHLLRDSTARKFYDPRIARAGVWAFWSRGTNCRNLVIVAISSNAVYRLSDDLADKYARAHGLQTEGKEFFVGQIFDMIGSAGIVRQQGNAFGVRLA